jgi:hypothetical protein
MSGLGAAVAAAFEWRLAVAAVATAIAGVMRGFAGFGTALTLAPVYSVLWGPAVGVPTMLLMEALIGSQLLVGAWRHVNRRVALPMAGAACLAVPFGAWVLVVADPAVLTRAMGVLVILFAAVLASGWRYRGSRPLSLTLAVGATAGLMKGSTGMSGPPVILYMLAGSEEAREHRANLILFTMTVLVKVALLVPVLLVFVRLGAALFGRVGQASFRAVAYAILVAVGLVALIA